MPLIEEIKINRSKIFLWEPEEEITSLLKNVGIPEKWKESLDNIKLEKRKKEWLILRILLNKIFKSGTEIKYTPDGKPVLKGETGNISISHTENCIALAFHPIYPIGIDVEKISDKVLKVKSKFLNKEEIEFLDSKNEIIHTLIMWSAKESLFKALGTSSVDFKEHLHIEAFTPSNFGILKAKEYRSISKNTYTIYYKIYSNFVFTHSMKDNGI